MTSPLEVIRSCALELGFNRLNVANVEAAPGIDNYDKYLSRGHHAEMGWMVRSRPPRAEPELLLPGARSLIVFGVDYRHPRPARPNGVYGKVSSYAWGRDYHKMIGKRLLRMSKLLRKEFPSDGFYTGVDSRPFIERAWAERAGTGYIGKNTMIISPSEGSFFFLAMLLTTLELEPTLPLSKEFCGRCRRCLDGCPTNAFVDAYQLDSRRCISYLTIEHPGDIALEYREPIGDWLFGCDVCQDVCPHNHRLMLSKHPDLAPRPQQAWVSIEWLLNAPENEVLERFAGSPLRRAGYRRLQRNAAVVLGNQIRAEVPEAISLGSQLKGRHISPLVDRHLQWAMSAL